MTKHLIDLDEDALAAARFVLGTSTMRETVNRSLRLAAAAGETRRAAALDTLAAFDFDDRSQAWR